MTAAVGKEEEEMEEADENELAGVEGGGGMVVEEEASGSGLEEMETDWVDIECVEDGSSSRSARCNVFVLIAVADGWVGTTGDGTGVAVEVGVGTDGFPPSGIPPGNSWTVSEGGGNDVEGMVVGGETEYERDKEG